MTRHPAPLPTYERRLLPYPAAAAYLGISVRSMKTLARDGNVPKTHIRHRVLFDREDLDRFIDAVKRAG